MPPEKGYSYFPCIFWRFARKITFRATS
jgi:hypothetical protein